MRVLLGSPPLGQVSRDLGEAPERAVTLRQQKAESNRMDFALLSIADSGPGVPDSDKEKIFEKFHQVRNGERHPSQGVGLGLTITRSIVEAHRGAVWVEDNPEGGSRFIVLLPTTTVPHKAAKAPSLGKSSFK